MPTPSPLVTRLAALLTRRRLTLWGAGLLVLGWLLHLYTMLVPGLVDRAGRFKGSDYVYFYVSGSLVLDGRAAALYDPDAHLAEGRRRIDPDLTLYAAHPNYGPQIALLFAPLARLPFGPSLALFLTLSAGLYALGVWLIWRACPALRSAGGLVALLACASPLVLTVVRYGQLSALTLFCFAAAYAAASRARPFAAGLAIGCLVYKPQLGLVVGVVMLAAREWRIVAGAVTAAAAQLAVAWWVAGSSTMSGYIRELWALAMSPGLVQLYPSEVHSARGFLQLLLPSPAGVTIGALAALVAALILAVRTWTGPAPNGVRWAQVVVLTILASPHVLTYDLLLLTLPLLVLSDWAVANPDHPRRASVAVLLVPLALSPFSSNLARLTHVQLSVLVMAWVAWRLHVVATDEAVK